MTLKETLVLCLRRSRQWVTPPERQLQPERLLREYRKGTFPMISKHGLLEWRNPDRRAIVPLDERFTVGKRLRKKLDGGGFQVTFDRAFSEVIQGCAEGRSSTWITGDIVRAFTTLHELGHAHSVEVWQDGKLVGGEYGLAIGGFYSGESMFTRVDYAGRVAMVHLVMRLRERGYTLLDSQYMNPTAREFGAIEIERAPYQQLLADALARPVSFGGAAA